MDKPLLPKPQLLAIVATSAILDTISKSRKKKEEKIRATLSEQIQNVSSANPETLQSLQTLQKLPIQTTNFINLRDKEFLSVQEAAILLGASRWTIQRMINRNELKASKIGRRTIIKRTEIDNLFK